MTTKPPLQTQYICSLLQKIKDAYCYSLILKYDDSEQVALEKRKEVEALAILKHSGLIAIADIKSQTVEFDGAYLDITLRTKGLNYLSDNAAAMTNQLDLELVNQVGIVIEANPEKQVKKNRSVWSKVFDWP